MTDDAPAVLLVDDDPDFSAAIAEALQLDGMAVAAHGRADGALAALTEDFPGVVVTDIRMPGMTGLQLAARIRALDPDIPVVLVTGHGDVDLAVAALKDGAYDFIAKPFPPARLTETVRRAAEKRALVLENRRLRALADAAAGDRGLIGETPAVRRLRATIADIADAAVDVLVEGETGAGKEVVARLLHDGSRRRARPFVALNCGALPESVIESELFGHEAGAFTGAQKRRVGRIEHAAGGTLFLDEIESMPPGLQTKLLRVLETRVVEPLGTNEARPVDLRVVAATKVDLGDPAARGSFRADLYYRLNVVTLKLPPLRERRDDVPLLFAAFLARAAEKFARPVPAVGAAVRAHLQGHSWPGNVRELLHYAERVVLGLEPAGDDDPAAADPALGLAAQVDRFEAALIRRVLAETGGSVAETVERLKLPRKTFYDKLKRHGIVRAEFAGE